MEEWNYRYYGVSEKGRRHRNEDAVLTLKLDENTFFFAIADGMGGMSGGEIASQLAIGKITDELLVQANAAGFSPSRLKEILIHLFQLAQKEIKDYVETHEELKGMGTTLAAILIHKDQYVWGNIGDSRIYNLTKGKVSRLTVDHNLLEDTEHKLGEGEFENLPEQYKHALTRVIDGNDSIPDIFPTDKPWLPVEKDTTWIICSDGLIMDKQEDYNQLLFRLANKVNEPQHLAQRLVSHALEHGSNDNVSVVVVKSIADEQHEEVFADNTPTLKMSVDQAMVSKSPEIKMKLWVKMIIIILIVMGFLMLGFYFGQDIIFREGSFLGAEAFCIRDVYVKSIL